MCNNGVLSVEYGSAEGDVSAAEFDEMIVEETEIPVDETYLIDEFEGTPTANAIVASSMCVGRASAYDNLPVKRILMTRVDLNLAWMWDGQRIRSIGKHSIIHYYRNDGWSLDYKSAYVYYKTMGNGYWVKQGEEGWAAFEWFGRYWHEHRMIVWVNRVGGCWVEGQWQGTLPGKNNNRHTVEVFRKPWAPA